MQKKIRKKSAIFFTILFMVIIAAPLIIISIDDSIDITYFYGENEEEEKEGLKVLFEITSRDIESCFVDKSNNDNLGFTFKSYQNPHINLIFPPPERILS